MSHSQFSRRDGRRDHRRRFYYSPYSYYPYLGYAWYNDPFFYDSDDRNYDRNDNGYAAYDQPPDAADDDLRRDVQNLGGKIDRLQADVEARNRPAETEPATALVFRDRHVEEVRNYAISGGTLWVLNDSAAKKIPLAQLDLEATARKNDERGVDFQIPK